MTRFAVSASVMALFAQLLSGCATPGDTYTNEDFKRASRFCYDQAYANQRARTSDWFTRYLDCRRERVMPIEIYAYRKETEVRELYDEMYKLAPLVDGGKMSAKSAYERWDQLTAERLGTNCALRIEKRDGGDHCVAVQSIKTR